MDTKIYRIPKLNQKANMKGEAIIFDTIMSQKNLALAKY